MLGVIVDQAQRGCSVESIFQGLRFLRVHDLGSPFAGQAALQGRADVRIVVSSSQPPAVALSMQVDPEHRPPNAFAPLTLAQAFDPPRFPTGGRFMLGEGQVMPGQVDVIVGDDPALQLRQVSTLHSYLNGKSEPRASSLVSIAQAVQADIEWLVTGKVRALDTKETSVEEEYSFIPLYDAHISQGHGAWTDGARVLTRLAFTRYTLSRQSGPLPLPGHHVLSLLFCL